MPFNDVVHHCPSLYEKNIVKIGTGAGFNDGEVFENVASRVDIPVNASGITNTTVMDETPYLESYPFSAFPLGSHQQWPR